MPVSKSTACLWVLMSTSWAAGQSASMPAKDVSASTALALDLVRAMRAYDDSVESLSWHEVLKQELPGHGDGSTKSDQCFDDRGRWSGTFRKSTYSPSEDRFVEQSSRVVFDGLRLLAMDVDSKRALVTDYHGQRRAEAAPDCFLGRHVDPLGRRRLGELLLDARNLTVSPGSTPDRPRVEGTVVLDNLIAIVQVEIDPEHGLRRDPLRFVIAVFESLTTGGRRCRTFG